MPSQIVLIMTDTQRTDMLGCYDNFDIPTPHLVLLANASAVGPHHRMVEATRWKGN